MLLIDLTHTCHTRARTGIQQVCRGLFHALEPAGEVLAVTHDRYRGAWRPLAAWELANLRSERAGAQRRARWPATARWRGRLDRWLDRPCPRLPVASDGVLVPELFSPVVAAALPALFAGGRPRVALFHDAVALRLPELTPLATVERFPSYLQELARFDGIAAVSDDARAALLDYWAWLGWDRTPPVETIRLGTRTPQESGSAPRPDGPPVVLAVGSIEARKNHLALLQACEQLWAGGASFHLHLVGLARPETGQAALDELRRLQARQRPVSYEGAVGDAALAAAYRAATFTVYPSLMEGFGLPVLESLQAGRPCICSAAGALGEIGRGGGCLLLDRLDAPALAGALDRLLHDQELYGRLRREALARPVRTAADHARELRDWMATLRSRAVV